MHLEAHLTTQDFVHAFAQLTPIRLALDESSDKRFIALSTPIYVSLVAQRGLRIVTDVQLQWDVIGLRLPVSMNRVSVLLTPNVVEVDGQAVLAFGVRIEDADLSAIPSFVESVLLDRVNDALAKRETSIAWRFMETLDFSFRLPESVSPRYRVRLYASTGSVRVDARALVLRVDWGLEAHPHEPPHSPGGFTGDGGVPQAGS
ncbi:MAG TPA: hypothetical protein VJR89_36960 [Polyangiales bacterium]|nr:hypothetical protein [Polyangiales bacterium]